MFRLLMMVLWFGLFASYASANEFAEKVCEGKLEVGWQCLVLKTGGSWNSLSELKDESYRYLVQRYNRQNTRLKTGQSLVLPPTETNWMDLSPLPEYLVFLGYTVDSNDVIVFSPRELAWGHYLKGQLVAWGPAVGGKKYFHTPAGTYHFMETAGANRRSSLYPEGCAVRDIDGNIISRSKCAQMPYFARLTEGGLGLHGRPMEGKNASHGCIGVFKRDAHNLIEHIRNVVGKNGFGWLTSEQQELSPILIVLPYN